MAREDDEAPIDVIFRGLKTAQVRNGYRSDHDVVSLRVKMREQLNELVREASTRRNLSMTAYIRRATLAFVAHDLGLDFDVLTANQWSLPRFTEAGKGNRVIPENEIEGVGLWKIHSLD